MKIALTVGHSILKNGNITSADGKGFGGGNEYSYNKVFAKSVRKQLKLIGHSVDLIICPEYQFEKSTEERDYKLGLINSGGYDLVIELHLNASGDYRAEGCEVLYKSEKGRRYAERVENKLSKVFNGRGIKSRDDLYMLNQTAPTAIIIETFFCTNKKEWKYANFHKRVIGKLIADGIGK